MVLRQAGYQDSNQDEIAP